MRTWKTPSWTKPTFLPPISFVEKNRSSPVAGDFFRAFKVPLRHGPYSKHHRKRSDEKNSEHPLEDGSETHRERRPFSLKTAYPRVRRSENPPFLLSLHRRFEPDLPLLSALFSLDRALLFSSAPPSQPAGIEPRGGWGESGAARREGGSGRAGDPMQTVAQRSRQSYDARKARAPGRGPDRYRDENL